MILYRYSRKILPEITNEKKYVAVNGGVMISSDMGKIFFKNKENLKDMLRNRIHNRDLYVNEEEVTILLCDFEIDEENVKL